MQFFYCGKNNSAKNIKFNIKIIIKGARGRQPPGTQPRQRDEGKSGEKNDNLGRALSYAAHAHEKERKNFQL